VSLGDLQQMTMLAVIRLGSDAYGAAIRDELRRVADRTVSVQTIWVTLVRLEKQGLVESTEAPREAGRRGRARRVFRLTPEGSRALETARASMARMWNGVVQP
jgi:PadR family transcriptional regulator PadR